MDYDLERRAAEVFGDISELPPQEQDRAIRRACGDDAELLRRVKSLAAALFDADNLLSAPTFVPADPTSVEKLGPIGPYKLLQVIGRGGFGVVYMAQQEQPVKRKVALKIIKLGMDTAEVVARFEAERQALAMMDHPNIARVFDAGATESGRPYFVMELVNGVPITAYCDGNRLTARQRLELMIPVCRAVQSAHQKGVIHRDLKPSNVMVTLHDGRPVPKVIDFGIAKATGAQLTERTLFTAYQQFVGTPAYMSPEQAEMSGLDIDTRTDVYGLGVLLYELLTGTTPIDQLTLKSAAYDEMRRMIRETEPAKPSTRLGTLGGTLSAVAAARGSDPRRLGHTIRGELDWIVMKALEKDRGRRYDTAAALADDLGRHLSGEPVAAGPPGGLYRLRKVVRRNRTLITSLSILAAALGLGAVGTTVGLIRESAERKNADRQRAAALAQKTEADRQRQLAEARFADVHQLADDLMFKIDDALTDLPGATRARRLLACTAEKYLDRLSTSATADDNLARDLAVSYQHVGDILGNPNSQNVGDTTGALQSYLKMLEIHLRLLKASPDDRALRRNLALGYGRIGDVELVMGKTADAITSDEKAVEQCRELFLTDPGGVDAKLRFAEAYTRLASAEQSAGRLADASVNDSAALELVRGGTDPESRLQEAVCLAELGDLQSLNGKNGDAMAGFKSALEICQGLLGEKSPGATTRRNIAVLYGKIARVQAGIGQTADATVNCQAAVDQLKALVALDPADTHCTLALARMEQDMGGISAKAGRPADALASDTAAQDLCQKLVTADPADKAARTQLAGCLQRIGDVRLSMGQSKTALDCFQSYLKTVSDLATEDPTDDEMQGNLAIGYGRVGNALRATGRTEDALSSQLRALAISRTRAERNPASINVQRALGNALDDVAELERSLGKSADSEAHFWDELAVCRKIFEIDPTSSDSRQNLAAAFDRVGDVRLQSGDTAGALDCFSQAEKIDVEWSGADPGSKAARRNLAVMRGKIGNAELAAGRNAEARGRFQSAVDGLKTLLEQHPDDDGVARDLANLYQRLASVETADGHYTDLLAAAQNASAVVDGLLAKNQSDPDAWELELICHQEIGDWYLLTDRPAEAFSHYNQSLTIATDRAKADPAAVQWIRDSAISRMKVAGARLRLAAGKPESQILGDVRLSIADLKAAHDAFFKFKQDGVLTASDSATLEKIDTLLDQCATAAAQLQDADRPTTDPATSRSASSAPGV